MRGLIELKISDAILHRFLQITAEALGYSVTDVSSDNIPDVLIADPDPKLKTDAQGPVIFVGRQEQFKDFDTTDARVIYRPFLVSELTEAIEKTLSDSPTIPDDRLLLDKALQKASYGKKSISLTEREYSILSLLLANRGRTVSLKEIENTVLKADAESNVVAVYMTFLRKKLEKLTDRKLIENIRNVGYMLRA